MVLIVVAAALKNEHNEVLIQRRPAHKNYGGMWEFPGGKLEAFETPEMALRRELKEELDIEVNIHHMKPCGFNTHHFNQSSQFQPPTKSIDATGMMILMLYIVRKWSGEIAPLEGQPYVWVNRESIYDYAITSADLPLIPNLWQQNIMIPTTEIMFPKRA